MRQAVLNVIADRLGHRQAGTVHPDLTGADLQNGADFRNVTFAEGTRCTSPRAA